MGPLSEVERGRKGHVTAAEESAYRAADAGRIVCEFGMLRQPCVAIGCSETLFQGRARGARAPVPRRFELRA